MAAMKVGTDGVLLGAWAEVENHADILDVGTGTGLIALMLAQRNSTANIDAIDLNENAVIQAQYNFMQSEWSDRLKTIHSSLQNFKPSKKYDLIISNPPYFDSIDVAPSSRNSARHIDDLSLEDLIFHSKSLLNPDGIISLILPKNNEEKFCRILQKNSLFLHRKTDVRGNKAVPIKRILVEFSAHEKKITKNELVIEKKRHQYTNEYTKLTRAFYLKM